MADKGTITGKDTFDGVYEEADRINKKFLELLDTFNKLSKTASTIKTPTQANDVLDKNKRLYEETNIALKERERLAKLLATQEERNRQAASEVSKNLAKQRYEAQQLNRANRESAISTSNYASAYQKLEVRLKKSRDRLRELYLTQGEFAKSTQRAAREVQELDARLKKADAISGQFQRNVGNYPTKFAPAIGALRQLVGAFGVVEGIRLGARLIKDSIALANEAKGVEFAFERMGKVGVKAFNDVKKSTRGLLSDLDIKKSLVDFQNFNIDLEQSAVLFEFLSVRAAQTGKSVEYLRDSLVEGLSKESKLRIDNLGISAAALNEELKKTPNFAQAVANIAKTEIKEAGNILEEAASGAAKFNASMNNISVNFGKLFTSIKGIGFINDFLEDYNNRFDLLNKGLSSNLSLMEKGRFWYRNYTAAGRIENARLLDEINIRKENAKAIKAETDEFVRRNKSLAPLAGGKDPYQTFFDRFQPEDQKRLLADINKELEKYNNQLSEGAFSTREEAKVIQDKIKALEKERDAILGTAKARTDINNAIKGTISWYNQEIAKETQFQTNQAKTRSEIQESVERVKVYQKAINDLTGAFEKLQKVEVTFSKGTKDLEGEVKKFLEPFKDVFDISLGEDILKSTSDAALKNLERDLKIHENTEKAKTLLTEQEAEKRAKIIGDLFSSFSNIYGLDLSAFEGLLNKKTFAETDWAATANSAVNLFYDGKFAKYEEDARRNRMTLDAVMNDTNASDKKKEQAQKEFDKKERQLNIKKAQAAKDEALFQIAISTAVAFVKSLPNYVLAATVAAAGAIQAGLVASRKIPQFFKGTEYAPRGWAWTDEKGPEIQTDRKGNIKDWGSDKGPRLKFLESGDKIFTAEKTRKMINTNFLNSTENVKYIMSKRLSSDMVQRDTSAHRSMDTKGMEKAVERALSKFTGKSFNIHNNVTIQTPRTRY